MLAKLVVSLQEPKIVTTKHTLVLLPKNKTLPSDLPERDLLSAVMKRRHIKPDELTMPVVANHSDGNMLVWAMVDFDKSIFNKQTQIRKAMQLILDESPLELAIIVKGDELQRQKIAEHAIYSAWVNGACLPEYKKKDSRKPLKKIMLYGVTNSIQFAGLEAQAAGNLLCRSLTVLPPNELTPTNYRQRIKKLAKENKWKIEEFDMKALRKMGAGAFVAVAQGSHDEDAAIVHLQYRHTEAQQTVALVGKGICFDTGGHNLKPARYMNGMHEDMNGSAVALGILLAATQQQKVINIDCWLAIAQNHIGPKAYKQNDIVTALNGTTIEIMHTDAEGRMVLADTLTLAARSKPNLLIDFATLTGSMAVALGARYSGVLGNSETWLQRAIRAGKMCGERLCAFPLDEDYEAALDSKVADIKQCTLDGEADHILAARFLKQFLSQAQNKKIVAKAGAEIPWLHIDLSASRCEGGLGSVGSDVTGFGVAWGLQMLHDKL